MNTKPEVKIVESIVKVKAQDEEAHDYENLPLQAQPTDVVSKGISQKDVEHDLIVESESTGKSLETISEIDENDGRQAGKEMDEKLEKMVKIVVDVALHRAIDEQKAERRDEASEISRTAPQPGLENRKSLDPGRPRVHAQVQTDISGRGLRKALHTAKNKQQRLPGKSPNLTLKPQTNGRIVLSPNDKSTGTDQPIFTASREARKALEAQREIKQLLNRAMSRAASRAAARLPDEKETFLTVAMELLSRESTLDLEISTPREGDKVCAHFVVS
ncbi:hypothetical protein M3Y98_00839900 [Aphelenchoides besseyi]|nr:hypothetical protein M3Y98_00839900 [Aphelenchoides besseyi]KAI6195504.1 hypothetical protein M3Y96_01238400 [Aphelenchoides besseyi]